jgi:hypothetical protein
VRKIPALVVTVGLLASLTACATTPAPGSAGCPPTGDAASVVTATGAFGEKPDAQVPSPIVTTETQVSTLIEGTGDRILEGTPVIIDYTLYDGTTGAEVEDSGYDGSLNAPITVGGDALAPLASALECSRVGSRVAVAIKASELSASVNGGAGDTDDDPDAAYVAIVDIRQSFLAKANGRPVLAAQGMPAVVRAPDRPRHLRPRHRRAGQRRDPPGAGGLGSRAVRRRHRRRAVHRRHVGRAFDRRDVVVDERRLGHVLAARGRADTRVDPRRARRHSHRLAGHGRRARRRGRGSAPAARLRLRRPGRTLTRLPAPALRSVSAPLHAPGATGLASVS